MLVVVGGSGRVGRWVWEGQKVGQCGLGCRWRNCSVALLMEECGGTHTRLPPSSSDKGLNSSLLFDVVRLSKRVAGIYMMTRGKDAGDRRFDGRTRHQSPVLDTSQTEDAKEGLGLVGRV